MTDKRLVHIKVFGGLNYGEEDNIQQLSAQLLDEGFLTLVTDSEWDIAVLEEHEVNEMLDTLAREMKTTLDKWLLKMERRGYLVLLAKKEYKDKLKEDKT